jgi:hypothetical protein
MADVGVQQLHIDVAHRICDLLDLAVHCLDLGQMDIHRLRVHGFKLILFRLVVNMG